TEHSLRLAASASEVTAHLWEFDGAQVRHDLSSCSGLRFWAKSDDADGGSVTVRVSSEHGSAETSLDLETSWAEVTLSWNDFAHVEAGDGAGMGGASPMSSGEAGAGGAGSGVFSHRSVRSVAFR